MDHGASLEMFGHVLLDDDDFRVELGPLGGVTVLIKHRGTSVKVPAEYARHFSQTLEELDRLGHPPVGNTELMGQLCSEFVEAIFAPRGGGHWYIAFGKSPADRARELIDND